MPVVIPDFTLNTGKSVERGLLVRLEDRDYQYFDGVYICMCYTM